MFVPFLCSKSWLPQWGTSAILPSWDWSYPAWQGSSSGFCVGVHHQPQLPPPQSGPLLTPLQPVVLPLCLLPLPQWALPQVGAAGAPSFCSACTGTQCGSSMDATNSLGAINLLYGMFTTVRIQRYKHQQLCQRGRSLCQWGRQLHFAVGRQTWRLPQNKGLFVPLHHGCIVSALAVDSWTELGPNFRLYMHMIVLSPTWLDGDWHFPGLSLEITPPSQVSYYD